MKRLAREPLLWFLLIGAGLFALDRLTGDDASAAASPDAIVVTQGRIENLLALFEKTWRRPPSEEETRRLVRDFAIEEALYREGLRAGLDQDDTIIRRRVRQKMEFVVDDLLELAPPTEQDLADWLETHPNDYARDARYAFRHVYFSQQRRGDALEADLAAAAVALRADPDRADWPELGDPLLLPFVFDDVAVGQISDRFGPAFAAALAKLEPGAWSGPVDSAFGKHLVRLDGRTAGTQPELDEVRAAVERDWRFARRAAGRAEFENRLLRRYPVTVEGLDLDLAAEASR